MSETEKNPEPIRTVFCKLENTIPKTCNTDIPHHIHIGKQELQIISQNDDTKTTYQIYLNLYNCNLQNQDEGCEVMSCTGCIHDGNFGESIYMTVPAKNKQSEQKNWEFTYYGYYEQYMWTDATVVFSTEDFEYIRNLYKEYTANQC